jgi:hypothetical protein
VAGGGKSVGVPEIAAWRFLKKRCGDPFLVRKISAIWNQYSVRRFKKREWQAPDIGQGRSQEEQITNGYKGYW